MLSLQQLGWRTFFQQQLCLDELETTLPARVFAQHRSQYRVQSEQGESVLPILASMPTLTVGDWLLLNPQQHFQRALQRFSLFSRKAAGHKTELQWIAANIDTVFIVASLNHDFKLNRLERYLALTHEAGVEPVIVLTKADTSPDVEAYVQQVRKLDRHLMVEAVNGLDANSVSVLQTWCGIGQTVAFLGSSGVGKSTLINTLAGQQAQGTGRIREDDSKGRHTTTARSLHLIPAGGLLLDTPGMRELQLADCEDGVEATFADVHALTLQCRFSDCQHQNEPGCAVQAALKTGAIDQRRLNSYQKLRREQANNAASLAEKRAASRQFGKRVKSVMNAKQATRKGD